MLELTKENIEKFDSKAYVQKNGQNDWLEKGMYEGKFSNVSPFDWKAYLERYEHLRKAGIHTKQQAEQHWKKHGMNEGRIGSLVECNQLQLLNCNLNEELNKEFIFISDEYILTKNDIQNINNIIDVMNPDIITPMIVKPENETHVIFFGGEHINGENILYKSKNFNKNHHMYSTRRTFVGYNKTMVIKKGTTIHDARKIFVSPFFKICLSKTRDTDFFHSDHSDNMEEQTVTNYLDATHNLYNKCYSMYKKDILIIEDQALRINQDCGSQYMYYFIRNLITKNPEYRIYFLPDNYYYEGHHQILQVMGVIVITGYPLLHKKILTHCYFDVIFVSRYYLGKKMFQIIRKELALKSEIIYFSHDIHHLRNDQVDECDEINLIESYDKAIIISDVEKNYLIEKGVNPDRLIYYPILYPSIKEVSYLASERQDIYFIGSSHPPNIEGITYFIENIFSKMNKTIKLHIIGKVCDSISNYDNVIKHGFVEDTRALLSKMKLNVVPLLSGAGMKGKIIESFQNKIPVCSTSVGMSGIDNEGAFCFDIHSTTAHEQLNNLYFNDGMLDSFSAVGYENFRRNYSTESFSKYTRDLFKFEFEDNVMVSKTPYTLKIFIVTYKNILSNIARIIQIFKQINVSMEITIINNNIEDESFQKKMPHGIKYISGDNNFCEWSGLQKALNLCDKNVNDIYLLTNETIITNAPLLALNYLNKEIIQHVGDNQTSCGIIDSLGEQFHVSNHQIHNWYRGNFIMVSNTIMRRINYNVMYIDPEQDVTCSANLNIRLKAWLNQKRYRGYNKDLKRKIILNEYLLSRELETCGEKQDIRYIFNKLCGKVNGHYFTDKNTWKKNYKILS